MAFSTQRGRPKTRTDKTDFGTPELRLKHALGVTAEPIDLCLSRRHITNEQHWSGLHLRWLYTLRYGAPVLTTHYTDRLEGTSLEEERPEWRILREREYQSAIEALKHKRRYEPVMRLCVFNETPAFLNMTLQERAWDNEALANRLSHAHRMLSEGLDILVLQWRHRPQNINTL